MSSQLVFRNILKYPAKFNFIAIPFVVSELILPPQFKANMNWVKKLLHFALLHFASKSCYILSQKVVTFRVKKLLQFPSKVVTFRVVTFCFKSCYILG